MKPNVPIAAAELAHRLRTDLMSELTGFRANVAGMGAAMLDMIAEQWDGAAARLVAENRATGALLHQGAALYDDTALAEASSGNDDDLRVSRLTLENERLRTALIALHARVEIDPSPQARLLEDAIWAELRRSVLERQISSANF